MALPPPLWYIWEDKGGNFKKDVWGSWSFVNDFWGVGEGFRILILWNPGRSSVDVHVVSKMFWLGVWEEYACEKVAFFLKKEHITMSLTWHQKEGQPNSTLGGYIIAFMAILYNLDS